MNSERERKLTDIGDEFEFCGERKALGWKEESELG
jgi:hypothetical protein